MRVTHNMMLGTLSGGLARSAERLNVTSNVASSGMRVTVPSDDPGAYATSVVLAGQLSTADARAKSASMARGDLELAESSLDASSELLLRAKEIAMQAANGSVDAATRTSMASEVDGLKQMLLGYANTKGASGYLFAGTKTNVAPFDAAGNFSCNNGFARVQVANNVTANTNVSGADAFSSTLGGRNLFADLDALAAALRADNVAGIQAAIGAMDVGQAQLVRVQRDAGFAVQQLDSATALAMNSSLLLQKAKATATEADPTQAYTDLAAATQAYQRSLAVTKQLMSMASLLTQ